VESKNVALIDVDGIVVTWVCGEEMARRYGKRLIDGYQITVR
jgi:hypothetical protein